MAEAANKHSILEMGNLLMVQERERLLLRVLRQSGVTDLEGKRAFEAGCSMGWNLRQLVQWGCLPEDVAGIDISDEVVAYARHAAPSIPIHLGSAETIPEPDESFDYTLAFTLFSSVPDEDIAHGIAREMFRITRPGGLILLYDMCRKNPRNPQVHKIDDDDVRRWFPTCPMDVHRITLAPPIARPVGRLAPFLYGPLAFVRPLRTHSMWVLERPALPVPRFPEMEAAAAAESSHDAATPVPKP